ncbi:MAG: queuosine precursor transporter [Deltaproteobacteria bacterium]|nr:queuosine precursor transporter [Deltaproteobacteria bacterium]
MKLDARLNLFITLIAVFMTCLVVGDLIGGKLTSFHLFGREWVFSVGQIAFPITFILTDIINEFYGKRVVRRVTLLAFLMVGLTFGIVYAAGALPWASFTQSPAWAAEGNVTPHEFHVIYTTAGQIQIASMFAFLVGNMVDISVFFALKRLTGNRFLWLRATGSTAVSQLIDTILVTAIAFGNKIDFDTYVTMVVTSYVIKLAAAIGVTPIIYGLHSLIETRFHMEPLPLEAAPELPEARIEPR